MKDGSNCCPVTKAAKILTLVGGINWGLVGLLNLNLVAEIFGADSMVAKIVYVAVGASAVFLLVKCMSCKSCDKGSCDADAKKK